MIDIGELPGQNPVLFSMPKQYSETIKQRKREWYQGNKDEILKRKRGWHAEKKKQKPRRPKPPPPTPEQIARRRELNNQVCHRYRATHLAQVRYINRVYYHRNRDRIVQQQRDRRAQQLAEKKRAMGDKGWKELQRVNYARRAESERRKRWNWFDDHLARPFPLPWLPLDWAESEPEEDTVQSIRTHALQQMDQFL